MEQCPAPTGLTTPFHSLLSAFLTTRDKKASQKKKESHSFANTKETIILIIALLKHFKSI